jgi:Lamin Tail Domain/Bacterial Ig-like domain
MRQIYFYLLFVCVLAVPVRAQITDNFGDGDFTSNPTWAGDNSMFLVNAGFQLQLNGTAADTSYLSMASPFIGNAEWQFWIRLNFAPSDNNYARFYIVSDVTNLYGPVNGYYVRLGENGAFDSVDLWEQSGTTHTKIIDGIPAHCAASNNVLRIKVTRDNAGLWNLYSDTIGGNSFLPEGSVTDLTHTTCNYIGVWCKYTVSNITRFYFDDVYAGPILVDTTAPQLVTATPLSATQLDVLFNEPVDLASSQLVSNYNVNNSIGNPATAIRDGSNPSLVHLTFTNNFANAVPNTLTVINVQDLSTNAISAATANFTWFATIAAGFRDVVINEILADPSPQVGLPNAEFVELHNPTANNFNLSGWTLTDGSSTATLGSHVLPGGGYVILCAAADTALFSPLGPTLGLSSFPSVNNSGDLLALFNGSTAIDSVRFDISWYRDGSKDDGGWTLELINPAIGGGCAPSGNWIASTNSLGGTPGLQNSAFNNSPDVTAPQLLNVFATDSTHVLLCFSEAIDPAQLTLLSNYSISNAIGTPVALSYDTATLQCVTLTTSAALQNLVTYTVTLSNLADCAGNSATPNTGTFTLYIVQPYDVVINEIMADPDPPQDLPNQEYVELHNTTPYLIYLENWEFTVGSNTQTLPAAWIQPNGYIALVDDAAPVQFGSINMAVLSSFPSVTNTSGTITLRTNRGLLQHTVSYDDSWYIDPAKANGGWSLEQIDPLNPCAGATNWRAAATIDGGTPGAQNSNYAVNPDAVAPRLLRVSVFAADSIRLFFSEPLDSISAGYPQRYTISNGIGTPFSVHPVAPDFSRVDLKLGSLLVPGVIYTATVSSQLTDCVGNAVSNSTAPFALPEPAAANDLVINEILPDPLDGGVDFVELYNRSQKVIDLGSLVLCTQDTVANILEEINTIAPDGFLLFPGEYVVLSENGNAVAAQYPASANRDRLLDMDNIPSMNIDGDIVIVADTGFRIIDRLVYSSEWHFPLLDETKGVTLERIDTERSTQDATNWHSAAQTSGFGTPTQKNSQYSAAPADDGAVTLGNTVFSPDNNGFEDVLNITYMFDRPGYVASVTIYDERGRLVRTLIRTELLGTEGGTYSWDGVTDEHAKARAGVYVVYFEAFNPNGEVKRYKKACVLAEQL